MKESTKIFIVGIIICLILSFVGSFLFMNIIKHYEIQETEEVKLVKIKHIVYKD